jgi:predicted phage terminase large subunit-like protein
VPGLAYAGGESSNQVKERPSPYYWQALYQQNPIAEGSAEWPESYFGREIWFEEWPQDVRCKIVALDPSKGTESKFGDYSAFVMLEVGADGRLYVDADLVRRNTDVLIEMSLELQKTFRADWFGVEVNQFQQLLAAEMFARSARRGIPLPLMELNNQVNKLVRIRRLTPYLAQGFLRFKAESPGARLLVEQLRDFPNCDHDDGPDALEMAVRLATELLAETTEIPDIAVRQILVS